MKVKLKDVNSMIISDDKCTVMLIKAPKRRYRAIIRVYYKKLKNLK